MQIPVLRFALTILGLALMVVVAGCGTGPSTTAKPAALRQLEFTARRALEEGELPRAAELARQILQQDPVSADGLIVAGYVAASRHQIDEAAGFYSRIPDRSDPSALEGRCLFAQLLLFDLGRAAEAERCYRRVLEHDPAHGLAHQGLATLMEAEGRRRELIPQMLQAIRAGRFEIGNLLAVGWVQLPSANPAVLELCRSAVPDDPLPRLGLARIAVRENNLPRAEQLLRELLAILPAQLEAQALLGQVLTVSGRSHEWLLWHSQLPPAADDQPDIWYDRGLWCMNQDQPAAAARCFWECCRRDPDHPEASYHLHETLTRIGQPEAAEPFLQRSRQLERLGQQMSLLQAGRVDEDLLTSVIATLESLGRDWEAWGWSELRDSRRLTPDSKQATQRLRLRLRGAPLERTRPASNPAAACDLSRLAIPDFHPSSVRDRASPFQATASTRIRLEDHAPAAGIDFTYFNGIAPGGVGLQIYQSMAGGIAVLDYDGDHWPDLYLPQGCEWSRRGDQSDHVDRLYRNLGNGRFADVTFSAKLGDRDYSQGVASGDFDNDGFADLYVANIGRNRLYHNHGDGTFTEITADIVPADSYWTSSVAIADMNGDGSPDLYDCTYLSGTDVYLRTCRKQGIVRTCSPLMFPAERDRLFLNLQDGRFQEIGVEAGISQPAGKGLGVVAADLKLTGRLSLYVANDLEANALFVNESTTYGAGLPAFVDRALADGVALDADGRAQASMGIAVGDANDDGRLDLFVTNYYHESNTLYMQDSDGLLHDATRSAGLRDPSFNVLGFGTQFLDLDLDGRLDLVVANGHLDDFSHEGIPFQMPTQIFHNQGEGRFVELPPQDLGAYFQENYLGRSVARIDWNRDGSEDFAISHLDKPFALLTNTTAHPGRFLGVTLCGVASSRDAAGTTVTVTIGDRKLLRQLTAGDGFMASNHRQLIFGLGTADHADRLEIRWPSGTFQVYDHLPANQHLLLIEGRSTPVPLHVER